jgi:hypothetical protein
MWWPYASTRPEGPQPVVYPRTGTRNFGRWTWDFGLIFSRGEKNLSVPRRSQADLCVPKRTGPTHSAPTWQISTGLLKIQGVARATRPYIARAETPSATRRRHPNPAGASRRKPSIRCNVSRFNDVTPQRGTIRFNCQRTPFCSLLKNRKSQIKNSWGFLPPTAQTPSPGGEGRGEGERICSLSPTSKLSSDRLRLSNFKSQICVLNWLPDNSVISPSPLPPREGTTLREAHVPIGQLNCGGLGKPLGRGEVRVRFMGGV